MLTIIANTETRHRDKKKSPVKGRGNLMFSQRNNPYCDLLKISTANIYSF